MSKGGSSQDTKMKRWRLRPVSSLGTTVDDGNGDSEHSSHLLRACCALDAIPRIYTCIHLLKDCSGLTGKALLLAPFYR